MKQRKIAQYPALKSSSTELKESGVAYEAGEAPMIRTQIYLNKSEHEYVQREASRRDQPMAAVIRSFIDEKMEIPEEAWTNNPMLEPTVHDPDWKGHEDAGINHDHYVNGCPKKWIKVKGKWVESPPLPDDYYENRASHEAYDREIQKLDESK
jgi:hypothetical protein